MFRAARSSLVYVVVALFFTCTFSTPIYAQTSDDFTVIVLPDTQFYSEKYPQIFNSQTQWIKNNVNALNIRMVVGVGDIVNVGTSTTQWQNADAAVRTLDGEVPYTLAIGNKDYDSDAPITRKTTKFNTYFGPNRYAGYDWYKGSFPSGSNENFYTTFSANGNTYLVLSLELFPRSTAVDWAKSIIEANQDKEIIITTHAFTYYDNFRMGRCDSSTAEKYGVGADNDGDELWNNLVKEYPNIVLVLSGHVSGGGGVGRRADLGVNGNRVNQILSDYQGYTNGGDGYLRIMKFRPSLNSIEVKTYSPYRNLYKTDAKNQFTVPWHGGATGTSGAIAGKVKNAKDCSSVVGATVAYSGGSTTTATNSTYNFSTVSPGTYSISVSASGYLMASPQDATVVAGFSAPNKFFLANFGTIAGRATNSSGVAIAGASISATGGVIATTKVGQTDASGNYSLESLPVGSYKVTASATGFTSQTKSATVSKGVTTTLNFAMAGGSTTPTTTSRLTGTVKSSTTAQPIAGATVSISGGKPAIQASTQTNTSGIYDFPSIPTGTYNVTVSAAGYVTQVRPLTVYADAVKTSNFNLVPQ